MYNVKKALNPLNTIEIFLRLKLNLKLATRRRGKFPFRKRSMPFSRHLEIF